MQESRLSSIIEPQEQDLGLLLPQAQRGQDAVEPIYEEHRRRSGSTPNATGSIGSPRDLAGFRPEENGSGGQNGFRAEVTNQNAGNQTKISAMGGEQQRKGTQIWGGVARKWFGWRTTWPFRAATIANPCGDTDRTLRKHLDERFMRTIML